MGKQSSNLVGNNEGEEEIARYKQFLTGNFFVSTMFSKAVC